jgi:hypothetical protein
LTPWITRVLLGFWSLAGLAIGGISATGSGHAAAAPAQLRNAQEISFIAQGTNWLFVTPSGTSSQYPTGPLVPGDRVLGRDDLKQQGSDIGSDYEVCTVSFNRNVLCDDMVTITNVGQLHITWMFQWPATGPAGPSSWSGVVDGGTGAYENAIGSYQAQALPNGDLITAHITRPT